MRNLLLLQHKYQINNCLSIEHIQIDHNDRDIIYASNKDTVFKISSATKATQEIYKLENGLIVGIQHLSLNDELCLATDDGEVIILNVNTLGIESVAFCDGGIERMCWSPDQEVIVFLTKTVRLVVMDTSYSPIFESELNDMQFGDRAFVNVGWGHKETQFHGTEGKAAAKQIPVELTGTVDIAELDHTVSIIWRGDSEYFAVSFVAELGRQFKVYDKEGKLQFTSEKSNGLEAAVCWRPSGTWIAIPQVLPNKYIIALFEKNGLKHREIVLPFKSIEESIIKLEWSSDSDVLAIETYNSSEHKSTIFLYTMCNYHWYQKQTLQFNSKVESFQWDTRYTEGKQLHVFLENQNYSIYRWDYGICNSRDHTAADQAMVAVIDGKQLFVTSFRGSVVPPPMCSFTVESENPINFVEFIARTGGTIECPNSFLTIDTTNTIRKYSSNFENGLLKNIILVSTYTIPIDVTNEMPLSFNNWFWVNPTTLIMCYANIEPVLNVCTIDEGTTVTIANTFSLDGLVNRIAASALTKVYFVTSTGNTYRVEKGTQNWELEKLDIEKLPDISENIEIYEDTNTQETKIFYLKHKHWLYLNGKLLATEVTSMFLTEKYLLFTTLDQLKFVRLVDGTVINERRMERGGRLVTVVPKDSRTVLQMPRGNLEVIQPRVLSLCIIGDLLNASEYQKAFDLQRKQRINLNLLMDHNPEKFLNEIWQFVDSVNNAHWLNLFLSDLENVDVTVTMYSSNYGQKRVSVVADKVAEVCKRICNVIYEQGKSDELLLPILTTHVKQKNLEKALEIVWKLKQDEVFDVEKQQKRTIGSQEALKYLLYLVDVNELYKIALGMYDFGLVLFVATKSQKDPKEYLPVMNEFKQITDIDYRCYKIDLYLRRYEKALTHIVKCGESKLDEAVELIIRETLFTKAMQLYRSAEQFECYKRVVYAFAEHLREKGKFRDASLMYERSGDYAQAIRSARHILDWQKCISLAHAMGQSTDEIGQLVSSLIPALVENGNHQDAAELIIKYQADYLAAIPILCDGKHYLKALYEARLNATSHLINSVIKPHLELHVNTMIGIFEADRLQFIAYKLRLATIRREKAERKLNNFEDDGNIGDDSDMFSDTSSMNSSRISQSSRGTGKTHRSSKNRRKHERKLLSLKEGNPFEDIALIDALYTLAHKSYDQQQPVRALGKAIIDQQLDAEGMEIQKVFTALLRTVRESLDEIWIPEMIVSGQVIAEEGNIDYSMVQDEQHYAMIKPYQRFKPTLKAIDWEFDVLM